jgi:hypothetical protein
MRMAARTPRCRICDIVLDKPAYSCGPCKAVLRRIADLHSPERSSRRYPGHERRLREHTARIQAELARLEGSRWRRRDGHQNGHAVSSAADAHAALVTAPAATSWPDPAAAVAELPGPEAN